jgi:hypothetical protein
MNLKIRSKRAHGGSGIARQWVGRRIPKHRFRT